MTSATVKLTRGTQSLNLNSGRYKVAADFAPPPYLAVPLIAQGTSANKSGGVLIDRTPKTRLWDFGLHVAGSSDEEIRRALADVQGFLNAAGNESDPVYLEYRSNSDVGFEPLWGNAGVNLRFEIINGTVEVGAQWGVGNLRSQAIPNSRITLTVKPFATGKRQRLASATGGVIEDVYGRSDGISRGLIVPEATTNLFTNPVFGNATYSTNWTIGSNLTAAQNTDKRFVLPGCLNSMKVFARNTTNNTITESLTLPASSHTITAYVMLPDLTAPTSTQLQIYYNSAAQTTTYEAVGDNGLYRCYATVTGTGGALATGVVIKNKYTVYLLGMQVEAKAYPTPLCYGDLLGCAWSSTAHASTSTRTAARARVPVADIFNRGGGTIVAAMRMHVSNTYATSFYPCYVDTLGFAMVYNAASDAFQITDGTNAGGTGALTFSPGAVYIIHFVYDPVAGLTQYVNGTANGTNATFSPGATGSYLYIGTDGSGANNTPATFLDFKTYDRPMTATEVANDYANQSALTADGQRVGCIPWVWDKDGDGVVDNYDDSTHDNFAVIGGIPGSAEAVTEYLFQMHTGGTSSDFGDDGALIVSLFNTTAYAPTSRVPLFVDSSGTVTTAADVGSAVETISVNTTAVNPSSSAAISGVFLDLLLGKPFRIYCRLSDAGSNLTLAALLKQGSWSATTEYTAVTADATRRGYLTNALIISTQDDLIADAMSGISKSITIIPVLKRSVAGAANVSFDYYAIFPGRTIIILPAGDASTLTGVSLRLKENRGTLESDTAFSQITQLVGDIINLVPNEYNTLVFVRGKSGNANVVSRTTTISSIRVQPRYALL